MQGLKFWCIDDFIGALQLHLVFFTATLSIYKMLCLFCVYILLFAQKITNDTVLLTNVLRTFQSTGINSLVNRLIGLRQWPMLLKSHENFYLKTLFFVMQNNDKSKFSKKYFWIFLLLSKFGSKYVQWSKYFCLIRSG